MPPEKVRKFCCFEALNGRLSRVLPIKPEIALIFRKQLHLQKNWEILLIKSIWHQKTVVALLGQNTSQKPSISEPWYVFHIYFKIHEWFCTLKTMNSRSLWINGLFSRPNGLTRCIFFHSFHLWKNMQLVSPFGLSKRPFIHMDQPFIVFLSNHSFFL